MHKVKTDASMSQSAIGLRRLRITNAVEIASRTYTYDALGSVMSRVQRCSEAVRNDAFSYNPRSELTAATLGADAYAYDFDDIGNRTTATAVGVNTAYTANSLNQYTAVGSFTPTFDADGNQTQIQTATGEWAVDYNAENRPVHWTQGTKVITMTFDRMGRRVAYVEKNGETIVKHDRFVYDNYLCIQRLDAMQNNSVRTRFVWDPTEPLATRPLFMRAENWGLNLFYSHDGNKNVSEVFYYANQNGIAAHYDYAPFGTVIRTARNTRVTNRDIISENPFRFSSEFHDDTLGLVYYNYRHYNAIMGRWCGRDLIEESVSFNLFLFCKNSNNVLFDKLGLDYFDCLGKCIQQNDPLDIVVDSFINQVLLTGAFGYVGIPKSFLAWLAELKGDKHLAGLIRSSARTGSPLAYKPEKVAAELLGWARNNGKIVLKAAKTHTAVVVVYGTVLASIELNCTFHCIGRCDYDGKMMLDINSAVKFYMDLFFKETK